MIAAAAGEHLPTLLMAAAAMLWYASSRALADGLGAAWRRPGGAAWSDAIGAALPAALMSAELLRRGETQGALALPVACAATSVLLALGATLARRPIGAAPRDLVVPLVCGVAVMLYGFHGRLRPWHSIALLSAGLALAAAARMRSTDAHGNAAPDDASTDAPTEASATSSPESARAAWAQSGAATLAAAVGAVCAGSAGTALMGERPEIASPLLASMLLAPGLVLPALGMALSAEARRAGAAPAMVARLALLLSLLVLPAAALTAAATGEQPRLPLSAWRVDAVLLIVGSLLLLPAALGRWSPGRLEGWALLAGYVGYLLASVQAGR